MDKKNDEVVVCYQSDLETVITRAVQSAMEEQEKKRQKVGFVSGLKNIAELMNLSVPTARKYLNYPYFAPAIISGGLNSKFVVNGDKLLKLYHNYRKSQSKQ